MPRFDVGETITPLTQMPEFQTSEGRRDLLGANFQIVQPPNMDDKTAQYYAFIGDALLEAHSRMSPALLGDRTKLNAVTCVDKNAVVQQEVASSTIAQELADPTNQVPGGAYYFWKTGLLKAWIAPRMFNDHLMGATHRGCGGILLSVGNDQRIAQLVRREVSSDMNREIDEQAAVIRAFWLAGKQRLSDREIAAIHDFHGPTVVSTPISSSGTASPFMTPRTADVVDRRDVYSLSDLTEQLNLYLHRRLSADAAGRAALNGAAHP